MSKETFNYAGWVVVLVYFVAIVLVASLSYEQGLYDGMKRFCPDSGVVLVQEYDKPSFYACENTYKPTTIDDGLNFDLGGVFNGS